MTVGNGIPQATANEDHDTRRAPHVDSTENHACRLPGREGPPIAIGLLAMLTIVSAATAAEPRPEISHLFPDFPVAGPRILTGENFEPGKTAVWCWSPPDVTDAQQLLGAVSDDETPLPEQPPSDARQVEVLDVERQIIVARPAAGVAWVKTAGGVSQPYAVDLARPCWLNPEQAQPKQIVHLFGFGLRAPYRETRIALRGGGKTLAARRQHESRAYRDAGPAVFFEVPADAAPGKYTVFVHNGLGGTLGWRRAGQIEVLAPKAVEQRLFSVQDYGAKGDDEANDFEAIAKAIAAAQAAVAEGVQPVLYFPPGKWRTDTTLQVPAGVWLRGSSRDLTTIEGCGDTGPHGHPTAIVHLASRTRIEEVTVKGMTWKGPEAYWPAMICSPPPVEDVTAQSIRVYAGDYRASQPHFAVLGRRVLDQRPVHPAAGQRDLRHVRPGWVSGRVYQQHDPRRRQP